MKVDWIITMALFLAFVAWSFSFYMSLFTEKASPLEEAVDIIRDKIMDFLMIDSYRVPIRYNSTNETTNSILYFNFTWPAGTKSSARIFQDGTLLYCRVENDSIYWKADLTNLTYNYFEMRFSNTSTGCSSGEIFIIENELQAIPWAMEKKKLVSQSKINEMTNASYNDFKNNLSITRDLRVEINVSGTETIYGKTLPLIRDVYVKETESELEDTGETVTVRVLVW